MRNAAKLYESVKCLTTLRRKHTKQNTKNMLPLSIMEKNK